MFKEHRDSGGEDGKVLRMEDDDGGITTQFTLMHRTVPSETVKTVNTAVHILPQENPRTVSRTFNPWRSSRPGNVCNPRKTAPLTR